MKLVRFFELLEGINARCQHSSNPSGRPAVRNVGIIGHPGALDLDVSVAQAIEDYGSAVPLQLER